MPFALEINTGASGAGESGTPGLTAAAGAWLSPGTAARALGGAGCWCPGCGGGQGLLTYVWMKWGLSNLASTGTTVDPGHSTSCSAKQTSAVPAAAPGTAWLLKPFVLSLWWHVGAFVSAPHKRA
eukprot:scaffold79147_cov14-Tisochrysis_lutea.AAC.3